MLRCSLTALVLLLSTCSVLNAQSVPGYLGKRFNFGYVTAPVVSLNMNNRLGINIPLQHRITTEFVLSRKISFTGFFNYSKSPYFFADCNFNYEGNGLVLQEFRPLDLVDVLMFSGAAGLKIYRDQYIAPIGRFVKFQIGYYKMGINDWENGIKGTFYFIQENPYGEYYSQGYLKSVNRFYHGIFINFGMGKDIPIGDRIIFELGNNINFFMNKNYNFKSPDFYSNDVDSYMYDQIYRRLRFRLMIDFNVGMKINI